MKPTKGMKPMFLVFNKIFLLIGVGILAYSLWLIYSTSDLPEVPVSQVFTYSLLGIGIFFGIVGVCGCCGGCKESLLFLKVYLALMMAVLIGEIAVGIFLHSTNDQLPTYLSTFWGESNMKTKNFIQKQLQCCGLNGPSEYARYTNVDSSCYNTSVNATQVPRLLIQTGCLENMVDWLVTNIPVWMSILAIFILIQLLGMMLSCCLISNVEKRMRVQHFDTNPENMGPNKWTSVVEDDANKNETKPTDKQPGINRNNTTLKTVNHGETSNRIGKEDSTKVRKARWHHFTVGARRNRSCWQWCKQDCMEIEKVSSFK